MIQGRTGPLSILIPPHLFNTMASARQNILVIQADQLAAPLLRSYGGKAKTPHLDSLATSGTVFKNFYCNYPLCGPSRGSMLTGKIASRVGVYDNAAELPASEPTVAHFLRHNGYRTCLSGKMHFIEPDRFWCLLFSPRSIRSEVA